MAKRAKKAAKTASRLPRPGWWEALPPVTRHAVCLALLLMVSLGFFAPIHFTGGTLIGGDTVHWRAMAQSVFEHREATGEEPLWARNAFAGMPAYMIHYLDLIPQLDGIPRFLRGFMWPTSHFFFLLAGAYLLVWYLTRDHFSGMLAAAAYGLTTYIPVILSAGHNTKFIALCFAPWLLLAFVHALRRPALLSGLLFAIVLAINLRADHVQITYYTLFFILIWWIAEGIAAFRAGRGGVFALSTAWLALGSVLALLMVAQPYLAHAEFKAFTIRGGEVAGEAGGLGWAYAMNWSQGAGELLTLLIANAFGGGGAAYWGPKVFTEGPHYVGGIVILLALIALVVRRGLMVWAVAAAGLVMVLFSLGENLPLLNRPMFDYFPLFDAFRVPETWLALVALALAVLAGVGLAGISRAGKDAAIERRNTQRVLITGGALAGVVLILMVGRGAFLSFEKPGEEAQMLEQVARQYPDISPADPQVRAMIRQEMSRLQEERSSLFARDATRTLLFVMLGVGLLWALRNGMIPAWVAQGALVVLVVFDLGGVGRRYVNTEALVPARSAEQRIPEYAFDTWLVQRAAQAGGPGHFRVLSLEGHPGTSARPSFFHESLGGYHGAKLRLYQDFLDHLLFDPATGMPVRNALNMMNTEYLVAGGIMPGFEIVFEDERTGMRVQRNPDVLPRAFLVGEVEVIEDPESRWRRIRDPAFDPSRVAIVERIPAEVLHPIEDPDAARVELVRHTAREIVLGVHSDATRLLVVGEVYYPAGWRAFIGDEQIEIFPVNHLMRGLVVPAGEYEVTMRFDPDSHRVGVWIAGVTTLLVYLSALLLLVMAVRQRRIEAGPAPSP
jgi:hypothetical protein